MTFHSIQKVFSRPLRVLVVAFVCTILFFSSAFPAAAISSDRSDLNKGAERLEGIQKKSEDVLRQEPRSGEELQSVAREGINELQGTEDVEKMNRPENSQRATSAAQQVEKGLRRATGDR